MGKRKHGKPERFEPGDFGADARAASDAEAMAAVKRFVDTFVLKAKRERLQASLLHRSQERRIQAIQGAYEYIETGLRTELEGSAGFPRHLFARFGDLRGVMLAGRSARHVSVAGAAALSTGVSGSLFIADSSAMAMLFPEIGAPTLCLK